MLSAASRFDTTEMSRVQSRAAHPAEVPRGTKLSESQLISATQGHLIKRHSAEPTGIQASHNPEVAGSNPATDWISGGRTRSPALDKKLL